MRTFPVAGVQSWVNVVQTPGIFAVSSAAQAGTNTPEMRSAVEKERNRQDKSLFLRKFFNMGEPPVVWNVRMTEQV